MNKKIAGVKVQKAARDSKHKKSEVPSSGAIALYNEQWASAGELPLDRSIFDGSVHKGSIYQAVRMYGANRRRGIASTKTRGDVSGGGKKPFRQKGTGQARAGSTRSPLWRHGGSVFGPHPRDFHYRLPRKILRLALISSLNDKINDQKLIAVNSIAVNEAKTKAFQGIIDGLKLSGKMLFVLDVIDDKLQKASRNIPRAVVKDQGSVNAYDVLNADVVVATQTALKKLEERLKDR